ncbi:MAG: cyclic nucleotide-binding domain-containing protein [Nitrospinae bacterium]|nr:cyclic nucleotide-binding domain-containing protein [Nitrospinota bacterium]
MAEPANEYIKTLMCEVPEFDQLDSDEIDMLSRHIFHRQVSAGTTLCKEGSAGDSLFYIINGRIEIKKESVDGRQAILARFGKGSSVGEMSLVEDSPRSATATAIEDVEILILTRSGFETLLTTHPQIGVKVLRNVAKSLSKRLRFTSGRFADVFR